MADLQMNEGRSCQRSTKVTPPPFASVFRAAHLDNFIKMRS
jgi:hypothetical protein